jgi:long-chain acyl-CoA synthetase
VDFEPDPRMALDANVYGAMHVADLAMLSPSKRYVHCSTCFVAGEVDGDIPEQITPGLSPNGTAFEPKGELHDLLGQMAELSSKKERVDAAMARAHRLGWPNIYTYTKGLSEHLLEERDDLVQTTVRPAIVECAREYPFVGWNEGVNTSGPIVWLLSTSFRRFPAKAKNVFDVVPVDTVARAMTLAAAATLRGEAKPVYHVASGHRNPLTFERALDLNALALRKRNGASADFYEREILRHLDSVCVGAERKAVFGLPEMRRAAQEMRNLLKGFDVKDGLPPRLYEKHGDELAERLRSWSMKCRTTDRKLSTIDEMLRQYRPFIHDFDYRFHTGHLMEATAALSDHDRALFGFDIDTLDWRDYWMNVQVPGLETWSIPILRGEKVPDDPPLPAAAERENDPSPSISVVA